MIVPLLPMGPILLGLAFLGAALGAIVNLAVYRLAWRPRAISPWSTPDAEAPPRRGTDFPPIFGWWGLSREAGVHGRGFWVRPMIVEMLSALLLPALYWWNWATLLDRQPLVISSPQDALLATGNLSLAIDLGFLSQALLALAMMAMSLIDLDEKHIPNALTVPGLLVGLVLATLYPWSLPIDALWTNAANTVWMLDFMRPAAPRSWPLELGRQPPWLLFAGLGCWWLWVAGLMSRRWIGRRGWRLAWYWFWSGLARDPRTRPLLALGVVGSALIAVTWQWGGAAHWAGLLTSLVGAAAGGGVVWLVRVTGKFALRREAMGFGDVTLMAMIGAFLGWQASLLVFFFAPFLGLVFAIARLLLRGDREIPFGPFLCAAALGVLVAWPWLWPRVENLFAVPELLAAAIGLCLIAMAAMLRAWRWVRERFLETA